MTNNLALGISEIKTGCTWQEAMDWARDLGEDWVLPNRCQLEIMYRATELGYLGLDGMGTGVFWSSSTYVYNPYNAWYVYFNNGFVDYKSKSDEGAARCVRLGWFEDLVIWVMKEEKKVDKLIESVAGLVTSKPKDSAKDGPNQAEDRLDRIEARIGVLEEYVLPRPSECD